MLHGLGGRVGAIGERVNRLLMIRQGGGVIATSVVVAINGRRISQLSQEVIEAAAKNAHFDGL